jgi:ABC-type Na+ transport system ATPase subunit NatA
LGARRTARLEGLWCAWTTDWIHATGQFVVVISSLAACDTAELSQEIALYGEFTIRETLIYFGWIYGMATDDVDEKTDFLLKLLQLPNASRYDKSFN